MIVKFEESIVAKTWIADSKDFMLLKDMGRGNHFSVVWLDGTESTISQKTYDYLCDLLIPMGKCDNTAKKPL